MAPGLSSLHTRGRDASLHGYCELLRELYPLLLLVHPRRVGLLASVGLLFLFKDLFLIFVVLFCVRFWSLGLLLRLLRPVQHCQGPLVQGQRGLGALVLGLVGLEVGTEVAGEGKLLVANVAAEGLVACTDKK